MFREIMNWFTVNYEMYLLIGMVFALINIHNLLTNYHKMTNWGYKVVLNWWGVTSTILMIPFYPIFIIIWLIDKLASWESNRKPY